VARYWYYYHLLYLVLFFLHTYTYATTCSTTMENPISDLKARVNKLQELMGRIPHLLDNAEGLSLSDALAESTKLFSCAHNFIRIAAFLTSTATQNGHCKCPPGTVIEPVLQLGSQASRPSFPFDEPSILSAQKVALPQHQLEHDMELDDLKMPMEARFKPKSELAVPSSIAADTPPATNVCS
jgi:hypothetical protein